MSTGTYELTDSTGRPEREGEDEAREAVEMGDVTQPWDVPRDTGAEGVMAMEPIDIQTATALQPAVAASPSVSQISQFLDTLNVQAEGKQLTLPEI